MVAFLIFIAVILLIELCCRVEDTCNNYRNEYNIIIIRNAKDNGDSSDEEVAVAPDCGKDRISHYQ